MNVVIMDRVPRSHYLSKRWSTIWTTGERGDQGQTVEILPLVEARVDDLDYW